MANEMKLRTGLIVGTDANTVAINKILNDATFATGDAAAVPTHASVKTFVENQIGGLASALEFKGSLDASGGAYPEDPTTGDTYVVTVAGTIDTDVLEVGDLVIYGGGSGWVAVQKNLDGIVTGPSSAVDSNVALFDGVTGETIKDSGVAISIDGTLASDADTNIPTEKAVKAYVDTGLGTKQNILTFGIADNNSVVVDDTDAETGDYAKFTDSGLEGRSAEEVKTDLALNNVTNDAQVKKLATSVDEEVVVWDGTTGDIVKESGVTKTELVDGLWKRTSGTSAAAITLSGTALEGSVKLVDNTTSGSLVVKFLVNNNGTTLTYNVYETTGAGDTSDLIDIVFTYGDATSCTLDLTATANTWDATVKYIEIV